jgi:Domain of unknown function DUF488
MLTEEFERIMKEMETSADQNRIAVMCAEAVPWRCHRQLLADAFLVRGWAVSWTTLATSIRCRTLPVRMGREFIMAARANERRQQR